MTTGEQRLNEASDFFRDRITDLQAGRDKEEALEVLQRLQSRVTSGLQFLTYDIEPESHAGEVFETLNDRGRQLTEMEKIKNYLLFMADTLPQVEANALADRINKDWSAIYATLAKHGADEDTLLRSHWLTIYDAMARYWNGASSVKARFSREKYVPGSSRLSRPHAAGNDDAAKLRRDLIDAITKYVSTLRSCALFTDEFLDPAAPFQAFGGGSDVTAAARASSARLRRSGVTAVFRPLLFAARLMHGTDGAYYAQLMDACERYAARVFVISQRRSNSGQARLYRLVNELHRGADPASVLREVDALTWYYADDETVASAFEPKRQWYWRTQGHKYFLYEYELAKAKRTLDVHDFSTYVAGSRSARTTEHILPQTPDWASGDWKSFIPAQHADLVHGIGNLVLTDDNSSYGRKSFHLKKGSPGQASPCYAESRLVQERELTLIDDWTPNTLDERRTQLLQWALQRWRVEPAGTPGLDPADESPSDGAAAVVDEAALADLDGETREDRAEIIE